MIWIWFGLVLCAALCVMIIRKVEKTNDLIRSQCMDVFNLKQSQDEFKQDIYYNVNAWGQELKACILAIQIKESERKEEAPVEKKKAVRRPQTEATKRKQAERRREWWENKKKEEGEKVKPSSFFKRQAAPAEGSKDLT